ncbi:MAG: hypothetical protein MJK04_34440 [Psychrosphaera sp.]|nr:hypothetical protein [Psychrosphaera sp.]
MVVIAGCDDEGAGAEQGLFRSHMEDGLGEVRAVTHQNHRTQQQAVDETTISSYQYLLINDE